MNQMNQLEQIRQVEESLRNAMLSSDVAMLDTLLADDLIVVSPDGQLVGKAEDLAAHRAGLLRIASMVSQETISKLVSDNTVIVFVLMDIRGSFQTQPFAGRYRYTRVWSNQTDKWQIIAAHISPVSG